MTGHTDKGTPWPADQIVEPTLVRSGEDGDEYTHAAWGQITLHDLRGGRQALYGSDFRHDACVEITIQRSNLLRNLGSDQPQGREELIAVRMTRAQWATFVASMGRGPSVQCTIDHVGGEPMPLFEIQDAQLDFDAEAKQAVADAAHLLQQLATDLKNGEFDGLSGAKRRAALAKIQLAYGKLRNSLPFITDAFAE